MLEVITKLQESFTQMDLFTKLVLVFWSLCLIGFIGSYITAVYQLIRNSIRQW